MNVGRKIVSGNSRDNVERTPVHDTIGVVSLSKQEVNFLIFL